MLLGEDKSNEIYGADDFPPPDSGDSSARQTPQPEIHMEAPPPTEYTKITMQRPDSMLTEADHRRDMPIPDGLAELEDMIETDGALESKLQKKINIVSASESKLQVNIQYL